jgi:uncharacterized protein YoxC
MVHLLNDLDKYTKLYKNLTDIKRTIVICTSHINDSKEKTDIVMKEVDKTINDINNKISNYEETIKYDLQEGT